MAAKGVNKVILLGNIGQDPETRFFPDGSAVTNVSLATSESWRDKQTGEQKERTEWHRLVFRDRGNYRLGQIAGEYIRKGSKIFVEGKLQTRKWQDRDGQDRYTTEVIVNELQLLDGRQQGSGSGGQADGRTSNRGGSPGQRGGPDPAQAPPANFDDDIPF